MYALFIYTNMHGKIRHRSPNRYTVSFGLSMTLRCHHIMSKIELVEMSISESKQYKVENKKHFF